MYRRLNWEELQLLLALDPEFEVWGFLQTSNLRGPEGDTSHYRSCPVRFYTKQDITEELYHVYLIPTKENTNHE